MFDILRIYIYMMGEVATRDAPVQRRLPFSIIFNPRRSFNPLYFLSPVFTICTLGFSSESQFLSRWHVLANHRIGKCLNQHENKLFKLKM